MKSSWANSKFKKYWLSWDKLKLSFALSGETTSISYAEKRFKLYDGVETFVMFIGYPRSSHSLVGAMLDAHPEIIIPHEYDVIQNWGKYNQSSTVSKRNLAKYKLFFDLHHLSTKQAMFLSRSSDSVSGDRYKYNVPGLWQGGYQTRIKVNKKVI